jgi:hypothetical protein
MKVINIIHDTTQMATDIQKQLGKELFELGGQLAFWGTLSNVYKAKRYANKIVNAYAVTELPFVLLIDDELPEDKQEYAAIYSEEAPLSIERIKAKI